MDKFKNRKEAGLILSHWLKEYEKKSDTIVLGLPRGGVPVAYEIAKALSLPLDIFIVRKLGFPGHEELAIGAIASGNTTIFNDFLRNQVDQKLIDKLIASEQKELLRREQLYRGNRPFPTLTNKTIILVDDGIATGASILAAVKGLRQHNPHAIIIAVAVAAYDTYCEIGNKVDKIIAPLQPVDLNAVGFWYENFEQISDQEVISLLELANR